MGSSQQARAPYPVPCSPGAGPRSVRPLRQREPAPKLHLHERMGRSAAKRERNCALPLARERPRMKKSDAKPRER